MKKKQHTLNRLQFIQLLNLACSDWEGTLIGWYAEGLITKTKVNVSLDQIDSMINSANSTQTKLLMKLFPPAPLKNAPKRGTFCFFTDDTENIRETTYAKFGNYIPNDSYPFKTEEGSVFEHCSLTNPIAGEPKWVIEDD